MREKFVATIPNLKKIRDFVSQSLASKGIDEKEIKKKYGIQFMLIVGFGRLTRFLRRKENSSCGVVITVDA